MARKQIAAANWKMNLTLSEAEALATALASGVSSLTDNQQVLLAVPFPYLLPVQKLVEKNNIQVAAQNMAAKPSGAYTGEVSAAMLKSMNIQQVLIGHSERRECFNEDNQTLAQKIDLALANTLQPVFCCGEPLPVREAGVQNEFVNSQLEEGLFHLSGQQITNVIIAYEPIWAIGTGRTATSEQAQEMHAHIRAVVAKKYSLEVANDVSILYGGSVKASNAEEIFANADVDGGLVGGASLNAEEFIAIIKALKK